MAHDSSDHWYVYVVECDDETLYTGITTDVGRRVREHNESSAGAKYTRSRRPVELVAAWRCRDQSVAASSEAAFKALPRAEKVRRLAVGLTRSELEAAADAYGKAFGSPSAESAPLRPVALAHPERREVEAALAMRDRVEVARKRVRELTPDLRRPAGRPIVFAGPGHIDGHALIVEDEPRVCFDVGLLVRHFETAGYRPTVHAAHEWAHALHYSNAPEFYPGNDVPPHKAVVRRLITEGLAVRCSEAAASCSAAEAAWFGTMESERAREWRNCADRRVQMLRDVLDGRGNGAAEIRKELFRADDPPVESRTGYWHGRQIVRRAEREADGFAELFEADLGTWRPQIEDYIAGL